MYRIQKRKFASNILEKKCIVDKKEKWIVFLAPLEEKKKGDLECIKLLNFYNNQKPTNDE